MKTIWKHPIKITDYQSVFMPEGSRLLTVQEQFSHHLGGIGDEAPPTWQSWWMVPDTTAPAMRTEVITVGTGNPFPRGDQWRYVCTTQHQLSGLCWHFFSDDGARS
jgi:hypothetical protein